MLDDWRRDYNEQRPHSKLAWATPAAFAILAHSETGRGAALSQGSAPRPLASTETQGSNLINPRLYLSQDDKKGVTLTRTMARGNLIQLELFCPMLDSWHGQE
jgi:hypothetical protein